MRLTIFSLIISSLLIFNCKSETDNKTFKNNADCIDTYLDYSNSDDQFTGGIKMIPIETKIGTFNVYTKRIGNNPKMRVLLLHGGPGGTHEEFDCFDGYLPKEGIEIFIYNIDKLFISKVLWFHTLRQVMNKNISFVT